MPDVFVLQSDRGQSPMNFNNDRYTPTPYEEPNERIHDDPPFKSSSPPLRSPHPTSEGRPVLFHLDRNEISDRRPSPAFSSKTPASPMPYQSSKGQGPEVYHIGVGNETRRPSPPMQEARFNDQPIYHETRRPSPPLQEARFNDQPVYHENEDHQPGKVTMYSISAPDEENIPPLFHTERNPSPPIRPAKKQQPVSYDILDDNNKYTVQPKQRPFPTTLHDVSSNIPYVPLTQSRATESIQRSMNKYRFTGS